MSNFNTNNFNNVNTIDNDTTEVKICHDFYERNIKDIITPLISSLLKDKPLNPVI